MSCRELLDLITDYLEGALSAPDRVRFEDHLRECSGCARYLDQLRLVMKATGRIEEEQVPAETMDRLLGTFAAWRSARGSGK